jgi:hypothetical protein
MWTLRSTSSCSRRSRSALDAAGTGDRYAFNVCSPNDPAQNIGGLTAYLQ